MSMRKRGPLFSAGLALLLTLGCWFPMQLTAQNIATAQLHGTVQDRTGAVVPKAVVRITDASKGFSRETTSDAQGNYQLLLLPPGHYTVTVAAPGFAKLTETNVVLTVGEQAELTLPLAVGVRRL